jgi:hypothetical protein
VQIVCKTPFPKQPEQNGLEVWLKLRALQVQKCKALSLVDQKKKEMVSREYSEL